MTQRRVGSKQATFDKVQHMCVVERSLYFKLKSKTAWKIVSHGWTILISPPPCCLPLVAVWLGNCLVSPKSQNTTHLFCAGSLGGAPIHTHFTNSKTKTLFKDIEVSYSTLFTGNWHLDASDLVTDCSAIATAIATRALAALLLLESITADTKHRKHDIVDQNAFQRRLLSPC